MLHIPLVIRRYGVPLLVIAVLVWSCNVANRISSPVLGDKAYADQPARDSELKPSLHAGTIRRLPPVDSLPEADPAEQDLPEPTATGILAHWPASASKPVHALGVQRLDDPRPPLLSISHGQNPPMPAPVSMDPVSMHLNGEDVRTALEMLSRSHGVSILVAPGVSGTVTANLEGRDWDEALNAILRLCGLVAYRENELVYVYSQAEYPREDLRVQVFPLDFSSAQDVLPVVSNLLSASGQATSTEIDPKDNRKTREAIIVTDMPSAMLRVADYIGQVDLPPPQVMIEAHVLQVNLGDDLRHGVNYNSLLEFATSARLELDVTGFVDPSSSPAVFAGLDSKGMDTLLQLLKVNTDAKTLASPRVMVVNGQTARIQAGEQIPYKVITVTETAAVEEVKFLDVGVILEVTPRISRCGRILMRVKPKVSDGTLNPETNLPGEETREVESDVLLENGQGLVIGGLIQEKDSTIQTKVPYLGDLRWIGRLFQKRNVVKERSEIIITLVPRICAASSPASHRDQVDAERSQTPLLCGPLERFPRPWEPTLPDAVDKPCHLPFWPRRENLSSAADGSYCEQPLMSGYANESVAPYVPYVEQPTPLSGRENVPGDQEYVPGVPGDQEYVPGVPGDQEYVPGVPGVPGDQESVPAGQEDGRGDQEDASDRVPLPTSPHTIPPPVTVEPSLPERVAPFLGFEQ